MRVTLLSTVLVALTVAGPFAQQAAAPPAPAAAPATAPLPSDEEIEHFLTEAKITKTKGIGKGVTGSIKATMVDGALTHDAQIQMIDEKKTQFQAAGASEFNFEDSWKFNVAAYRLDRLIGLNLVPVSVERRYKTTPAAFTWWIDDVLMDEGARLKQKAAPPVPAKWNEQMQLVRLFDQLIYNVDRNVGNLLISKDWRVWAIDHTRAFRTHDTLKTPQNVTRCDRQVLEKLKALDKETLTKSVGKYLTEYQIRGLLARRDKIVAIIDQGGPGAVFDRR